MMATMEYQWCSYPSSATYTYDSKPPAWQGCHPPQWDDGWEDTDKHDWACGSMATQYASDSKWWVRMLYRLGENIGELVRRTDSIRRKINAQSPVLQHAVGDIDWLKHQVSKLEADSASLRSVALHRWRDAVRDELEKLKCKDVNAAMELGLKTWRPGVGEDDDGQVIDLPAAGKACYDQVYDAVGQYRDGFDPVLWAHKVKERSPDLFDIATPEGYRSLSVLLKDIADRAADPSPSWTPPKAEPRRRKKGAKR